MVESTARHLLAVIPALLAIAGCGGEPGPPAADQTTSVATTPPQTTTSAPFAATDGTNLQACADGVCEVFVKTGDVLPNASGAGPVTITVENGMIGISHVSASGMSNSLSGYPGMPQQINQQVFLIVAVQGDQGVLRLSIG